MLELKNVGIQFGKEPAAVSDASFSVPKKKCTVVIGETGSGKSVLLLAILRLLPSSAKLTGKIIFRGRDLTRLSQKQMDRVRGSQISYIPQGSGNGLNPLYTVGHQIDEAIIKHSRLSKQDARSRTEALFSRFGIEDATRLAKAYPFSYSGGMRQRALIAMGIASDAQLVLADEPTKGLDQHRIQEVVAAFEQLIGHTLLCVTHDLRFAKRIADRVVVMYASQQIESCKGAEFFENPLHPYSRAMLEALPENGLNASIGFAPPREDEQAQSACHFYDRCPERCAQCRKIPPMIGVEDRKVRCWKYADGNA